MTRKYAKKIAQKVFDRLICINRFSWFVDDMGPEAEKKIVDLLTEVIVAVEPER